MVYTQKSVPCAQWVNRQRRKNHLTHGRLYSSLTAQLATLVQTVSTTKILQPQVIDHRWVKTVHGRAEIQSFPHLADEKPEQRFWAGFCASAYRISRCAFVRRTSVADAKGEIDGSPETPLSLFFDCCVPTFHPAVWARLLTTRPPVERVLRVSINRRKGLTSFEFQVGGSGELETIYYDRPLLNRLSTRFRPDLSN